MSDTNTNSNHDLESNSNKPENTKFNWKSKRNSSIAAIAILALTIGWVVYAQVSSKNSTDTNSSTSTTLPAHVAPFGPAIVSGSEIQDQIKKVGHAIYWAGEGKNQNLELTVTENGTTYIRYLPLNAKAGANKKYLTVVTFPDVNGYSHVRASGQKAGTISAADTGGAFVVEDSKKSTNAYFAFQNYPIQVEVFTPTPGLAWTLIQTGKISLVG